MGYWAGKRFILIVPHAFSSFCFDGVIHFFNTSGTYCLHYYLHPYFRLCKFVFKTLEHTLARNLIRLKYNKEKSYPKSEDN